MYDHNLEKEVLKTKSYLGSPENSEPLVQFDLCFNNRDGKHDGSSSHALQSDQTATN